MPEMDGFETIRTIRQDPQLRDAADHRPDRQGDEGRSREVHRRRARRTTSPSRSTSSSCSRCCASGCTADHAAMAAAELSLVKILLVDDEPKNLLALEAVLAGDGGRLRSASSGAEALMHLLQEDFAVILLDVNMPGMDGFETAALDPRPREVARHADHLPHRGHQGRGVRRARLRAGRGGLHLQAVRAGDPAVEGGGLRPVVQENRGSPAAGRTAGRKRAVPEQRARCLHRIRHRRDRPRRPHRGLERGRAPHARLRRPADRWQAAPVRWCSPHDEAGAAQTAAAARARVRDGQGRRRVRARPAQWRALQRVHGGGSRAKTPRAPTSATSPSPRTSPSACKPNRSGCIWSKSRPRTPRRKLRGGGSRSWPKRAAS